MTHAEELRENFYGKAAKPYHEGSMCSGVKLPEKWDTRYSSTMDDVWGKVNNIISYLADREDNHE